ncbi:MAG: CPBP family glutamic-type intramembrane protease [Myxococcota bacterium]
MWFGMVIALDAFVLMPNLPEPIQPITTPSWWKGLLAGFYGAIAEEVMLRLCVATLLIWLLGRRWRDNLPTPSPALLGTAVALSALLFGLAHLPAASGVWPLEPIVVARVLILNGLLGLGFGWIYVRRGLLCAMAASLPRTCWVPLPVTALVKRALIPKLTALVIT